MYAAQCGMRQCMEKWVKKEWMRDVLRSDVLADGGGWHGDACKDGGERQKTWVRFTFGRIGRRDFPDAGSKFRQSAWLIDNPLTRHRNEEKKKKKLHAINAQSDSHHQWSSSDWLEQKKKWLGNFALLTLQFIVAKHKAENIYVYKDVQLLQVSERYSNF